VVQRSQTTSENSVNQSVADWSNAVLLDDNAVDSGFGHSRPDPWGFADVALPSLKPNWSLYVI